MLRRQAKPTHEWSLTYVFFCRGDFLAHANDFREDQTDERTWFQLLSSATAFSLVILSLHLLVHNCRRETGGDCVSLILVLEGSNNHCSWKKLRHGK